MKNKSIIKINSLKKYIMILIWVLLVFGNIRVANAKESNIILTLYSNSNSITDAGHAWISITNKTNDPIAIGPYVLAAGKMVYIDARGQSPFASQIKSATDFCGGTFINYISVYANVYKDYAYISKIITKDDLNLIFKRMKLFKKYDLVTNNCTDFARKVWNDVGNKSMKIPSVTGVDAPQTLKTYIIKKLKGKVGNNLKKTGSCFYYVTTKGNLIPSKIEKKITGLKGKRNGNVITLSWKPICEEIGINQYNINKYQICYTNLVTNKSSIVRISNKCTTISIDVKDATSAYSFKVCGISLYPESGLHYYSQGEYSKPITFKGETAIKLDKKTAVIYTSGLTTVQLKATVKNNKSKIKWMSSNKSIATVNSKGKVTAKKVGTVIITAKVKGVTAKCKITVLNKAVTKVDSNKMYNEYKKIVLNSMNEYGEYGDFVIYDANKDKIPELYIKDVRGSSAHSVYTFTENKIKKIGKVTVGAYFYSSPDGAGIVNASAESIGVYKVNEKKVSRIAYYEWSPNPAFNKQYYAATKKYFVRKNEIPSGSYEERQTRTGCLKVFERLIKQYMK